MFETSKEHLKEVNQSYSEHFKFACKISGNMIVGGLAVFTHAVVPGLFTKTASNIIKKLSRLF